MATRRGLPDWLVLVSQRHARRLEPATTVAKRPGYPAAKSLPNVSHGLAINVSRFARCFRSVIILRTYDGAESSVANTQSLPYSQKLPSKNCYIVIGIGVDAIQYFVCDGFRLLRFCHVQFVRLDLMRPSAAIAFSLTASHVGVHCSPLRMTLGKSPIASINARTSSAEQTDCVCSLNGV